MTYSWALDYSIFKSYTGTHLALETAVVGAPASRAHEVGLPGAGLALNQAFGGPLQRRAGLTGRVEGADGSRR